MSSPRSQIAREPGSLKEAETALVKACGGLAKSAALTRVRESQLGRYIAPSEPDSHMPADVILSLEMHCQQPIVSGFIGMETQHMMLSLLDGRSAEVGTHLAQVGQETALLFKEFGASIADGTISPKEAGRIRAAVLRDMQALAALYGDLGRIIRGLS